MIVTSQDGLMSKPYDVLHFVLVDNIDSIAVMDKNTNIYFGVYSTATKADEVLDSLYEVLHREYEDISSKTYIYRFPKDDVEG